MMINDPIQKVRHTVAFVYFRLSHFVASGIAVDKNLLNMFVENSLNHIDEHPLIGSLLIGGIKNLFVFTNKVGQPQLMNDYFTAVYSKIFEKLYDPAYHQTNEIQSISDSITDIADSCDIANLGEHVFNNLNSALQFLANSTSPDTFNL